MIEVRPATAADLESFYGGPPPVTLQAWVGLVDDAVFGVIGLARMDYGVVFFSDYRPDARRHLRRMATLRLIRSMREVIRQRRVPVLALADANEPDSDKLLTRLGFEFVEAVEGGGLYKWHS